MIKWRSKTTSISNFRQNITRRDNKKCENDLYSLIVHFASIAHIYHNTFFTPRLHPRANLPRRGSLSFLQGNCTFKRPASHKDVFELRLMAAYLGFRKKASFPSERTDNEITCADFFIREY